MLQNLMHSNLTLSQYLFLALATFILGSNKAGLHGVALLAIPFFAMVLGARASLAYVALLFVIGDLIALIRYHKHIDIKAVLRLLPMALVGVAVAALAAPLITEHYFKILIAVLVFLCFLLVIYPIRSKNPVIGYFFGFLGGFSSMIGNLAGPVLSVYLLNHNLPKKNYLSIYTAFFFVINFIKLAVHFFYWKSLTSEVVLLDLTLAPFLLLGLLCGFYLVKILPEKPYRVMLVAGVLISCIKLGYDAFS